MQKVELNSAIVPGFFVLASDVSSCELGGDHPVIPAKSKLQCPQHRILLRESVKSRRAAFTDELVDGAHQLIHANCLATEKVTACRGDSREDRNLLHRVHLLLSQKTQLRNVASMLSAHGELLCETFFPSGPGSRINRGLIVDQMDNNPLDDIDHTNSISRVMVNGTLYNANTLAQQWPEKKPLPTPWWQNNL